jgi:hypothetical protein
MRALPILLVFDAMFYWLCRVRGRLTLPVLVRHDSKEFMKPPDDDAQISRISIRRRPVEVEFRAYPVARDEAAEPAISRARDLLALDDALNALRVVDSVMINKLGCRLRPMRYCRLVRRPRGAVGQQALPLRS